MMRHLLGGDNVGSAISWAFRKGTSKVIITMGEEM